MVSSAANSRCVNDQRGDSALIQFIRQCQGQLRIGETGHHGRPVAGHPWPRFEDRYSECSGECLD